ncbi:hypothetical protein EB796_011014 [Bugula neritina]|uniref:Uncharacterized protein n=1 Tax=Bugula neritina TaxID=10212 RepID=A0A7J7JZ82_BUGNE|nr:hypothetical protein EB796_011014 [Bugula neritina]
MRDGHTWKTLLQHNDICSVSYTWLRLFEVEAWLYNLCKCYITFSEHYAKSYKDICNNILRAAYHIALNTFNKVTCC